MRTDENRYSNSLEFMWKQFFQLSRRPFVSSPMVVEGNNTFKFSFYQEDFGYVKIIERDKPSSNAKGINRFNTFTEYSSLSPLLCSESPTVLLAQEYYDEGKRSEPVSLFRDVNGNVASINIDLTDKERTWLKSKFMASEKQYEAVSTLGNNLIKEVYVVILTESFSKGYVDTTRIKSVAKSIPKYKISSLISDLQDLDLVEFDTELNRVFVDDNDIKVYTERELYNCLEDC